MSVGQEGFAIASTKRSPRYVAIVIAAAIAVALVVSVGLVFEPAVVAAFVAVEIIALATMVFIRHAPHEGGLFLLFMSVFVTDLAFLSATRSAVSALDPQVMVKGTVYAVVGLFGLLTVRRLKFHGWVIVVMLYPLFGMLSAAWSALPFFTLAGALLLLTQVLLCTEIVSLQPEGRTISIWDTVACAIIAKLALSAVLQFVNPDLVLVSSSGMGGVTRLGGAASTNIVGLNAAILAVIAMVQWLTGASAKRRSFYGAAFLFALVALLWTQSRTALLSFIAGAVALLYFRSKKAFWFTSTVLGGFTAYLLLFQFRTAIWIATRGTQTMQNLESLEGRAQIWAIVTQKIREAPWFGHGFGAGRLLVGSMVTEGASRAFYSAHNMFLEVLINLGIAGLVLFTLALVGTATLTFRDLGRTRDTAHRSALLVTWGSLVVLFVNGLAESGLGGVIVVQSILFYTCLAVTMGSRLRRAPAR